MAITFTSILNLLLLPVF